MAGVDEHGRPEPAPAAGEAETVLGFLEFHRATLAWKCAGLDADGLRARVGASSMTWQDAVARSRTLVARALAERGLDGLAAPAWSDGRTPNLRWILVHLVEEYSRHNGHADLLRESVDGLTGE
jgi:hypothetical protein